MKVGVMRRDWQAVALRDSLWLDSTTPGRIRAQLWTHLGYQLRLEVEIRLQQQLRGTADGLPRAAFPAEDR